jgi:predicted DNA-binding protein (UPF0251 family)
LAQESTSLEGQQRRLRVGPRARQAFPDTSSRQQRRDAATWQEAEALRLAAEYALQRPGAAKQEVTRARIKQARKVASAWKRLAAELNF